jgi:predicted CxxxxCH...CXXCH cytochrome family protein
MNKLHLLLFLMPLFLTCTPQNPTNPNGSADSKTPRDAAATEVAALVAANQGSDYRILGWNNLGMHCYNRDCADFLILPPYNTLWVQVLKRGDPPQVVTSGITVEYSFPGNTYSAGIPGRTDKTNFWQYAKPVFNLNADLAPNVGLTGKGLSGRMDASDDHFVAEGIPLTEFRDQDVIGTDPLAWSPNPLQLASIIVKDSKTGVELARNTIVAPVSSELSCNTCHSDDGDATTTYPITPTGKVETNILTIHDYLNAGKYPTPLMDSRPVLCASCHSSNALGIAGAAGTSSLSNAMHNHHKGLDDITPDTDGCYKCHPGPNTQCLRCTMSQNFGMTCVTCHGTVADVATNGAPWLNEPRCDNVACHGAGYALDQPLYRMSKGHGGMYCAGCHDSPHVLAPSREPNDGIKFAALQGNPGTLRDCSVCHLSQTTGLFSHHAP